MTRIYFVRHGESTGNLNHTFNGHTDTELTEKGKKQGQYLGERFRDIPIDVVYTSPLKRARDTALLLLRYHPDVALVVHEAFIEIDGGELEGKPLTVMERDYPAYNEMWYKMPWDFIGPGSSDGGVRGAYERIRTHIPRLVQDHPGQTVVISSHGYMNRLFNCYMQGIPVEELNRVGFGGNACVSCADFEEGAPTYIQFINDDSHLPQEYRTSDVWKDEILDG